MLSWCLVLLGLGVLAFLDSQFNYGFIFRSVNSVLFLLVSLGLLIRVRLLMKMGFTEKFIAANNKLQDRDESQHHTQTQMQERESKQEVTI